MKKRLFILTIFIICIIGGFFVYHQNQMKEYKQKFNCLDQSCEIILYSKKNKNKEIKEIISYYKTLEQEFNKEVESLNKKSGQVQVSNTFLTMMKQLNETEVFVNNETLTTLWKDSLKQKRIPSISELKKTSSYYNDIKVEENTLTSKVYDINTDSYYFGYIAKKMQDYLTKKKISSYSLNLAGNITVGKHYQDEFHTAVLNPISNQVETVIKQNNVSAYTVGSDPVIVDGIDYVPVIDPMTKYPYTYHKSVTVVSNDPILANILSYKLYTMNVEEGKKILKKYSVQNVLWIENDGEVKTLEK